MDDQIYNDIVTEVTTRIQKRKANEEYDYKIKLKKFYIRLEIFSAILVTLLIIAGFVIQNGFDDHYDRLSAWIITIFILFLPTTFILVSRPRQSTSNWNEMIYLGVREQVIQYFSDAIGISIEDVEYDIKNIISRNKRILNTTERWVYDKHYNPATGRINTSKELVLIESFWVEKSKVDFIFNRLCEKYHRKVNGIIKDELSVEKAKLQNENLSLKNETIKIKINLTRPWTCQFCGNMNRGDDMSCLKCGGIRPSSE